MKVAYLFLLAALLVTCVPYDAETSPFSRAPQQTIFRYQDDEAGVVCWVFRDGPVGGIDCLPMVETLLWH